MSPHLPQNPCEGIFDGHSLVEIMGARTRVYNNGNNYYSGSYCYGGGGGGVMVDGAGPDTDQYTGQGFGGGGNGFYNNNLQGLV